MSRIIQLLEEVKIYGVFTHGQDASYDRIKGRRIRIRSRCSRRASSPSPNIIPYKTGAAASSHRLARGTRLPYDFSSFSLCPPGFILYPPRLEPGEFCRTPMPTRCGLLCFYKACFFFFCSSLFFVLRLRGQGSYLLRFMMILLFFFLSAPSTFTCTPRLAG